MFHFVLILATQMLLQSQGELSHRVPDKGVESIYYYYCVIIMLLIEFIIIVMFYGLKAEDICLRMGPNGWC